MGYAFDKIQLNNQRKIMGMTTEEMALDLGVSISYMRKLLHSKKDALTMSEILLERLEELGIPHADIGVNKKSVNRKPGRPRKNPVCPHCGK